MSRSIVRFVVGACLLLIVSGAGAQAGAQAGAKTPSDSKVAPKTSSQDWLESLQRDDNAAFPDSLFDFERVHADSALAAFDSLGLAEFERQKDAERHWFRWDWEPRSVAGYNRTTGSTPGLALDLGFGRSRLVEATLTAGYSFAAEQTQYIGEGTVRFKKRGRLSLRGWYEDRVAPFGSNRVTGNNLRALVGGVDAQDYLNRVGGGAQLQWHESARFQMWLGASRHSEKSMGVHRLFGLFGDMSAVNLAVTEGDNAQVFAGFHWGDLFQDRVEVDATHRISGGALGGDLDYSRTDVSLTARDYVVGNHEVVLTLAAAHMGGFKEAEWDAPDPNPVQALADIGGLSTVRGFSRRTLVGESSVATRLEWLLPYDVLRRARVPIVGRMRLQFVPWFDAARVRNGSSDAWLKSFGVGVQSFIGPFPEASQVRFDVAFPRGPGRLDDVVTYVSFSGGFY